MRKELYLGIIDRLKTLKDEDGTPILKTFDLWNEQVDFIEEEVFDTPAVFIEFLPIAWVTLGGSVQQADLSLRLHVVTAWKGSEREGSIYQEQALQRFDLVERIADSLFNFTQAHDRGNFCMTRRTGSATNHNHGELVEDIETFTLRAMWKCQ